MDIGKTVEAMLAAGPGAGIGLAVGMLLFVGALLGGKVVMIGRFNDMKERAERCDREKLSAEHDRDGMRTERDELRIMMAGALTLTRKNAHLASAVMMKRAQQEGDEDGPARLTAG